MNTISSQTTLNRNPCLLLLAFAIAVSLPLRADAGEIDELKAMIMKMEQHHQQEITELRKQIEQLSTKAQLAEKETAKTKLQDAKEFFDYMQKVEEEDRVESMKHGAGFSSAKGLQLDPGGELELEFIKPEQGVGVVEPDVMEEFFDRLQKLEREARSEPRKNGTGFTSAKGWQFDLGGELELEFVKTDQGVGVSEPDAHFQIDQLYLYPTARYKDLMLFSADISIKASDVQTGLLEEAWVKFFFKPYNTYVEAGLNDLFIANIQRKTETEILIENAFYRDDDLGIRVGGKPLDWLYWEASVTSGFQLGTRSASEDPSFPLIADRRNTSNAGDRLDLGITVGFNPDLGEYGKIDILPFYYNSVLSDADVKFLQAIPGYGVTNTADTKQRYGVNLRYDYSDFTILGQSLIAKDGTLNRKGWFVQPSYVLYKNPDWQWLNNYELVYRYNDLQVDLPHTFSNSLTWSRQQHTLGLLIGLIDKTSLKFEYIVNNEKTGGADVDNNEFLIQAEVIW